MNDQEQVIVAIDARENTAAPLAERVRQFLVQRGVVLGTPVDEDLSDDTEAIYPPGPGANTATVTHQPPDLTDPDAGVVIMIGRQMTPVIESKTELACASCAAVIDVTEDDAWYEAADRWDEGDDDAAFACPKCGAPARVAAWDGPSAWGFGWLSICFRNWPPVSPEFMKELAAGLGDGHRVRRVFVQF